MRDSTHACGPSERRRRRNPMGKVSEGASAAPSDEI
jgi:hypothetical protein